MVDKKHNAKLVVELKQARAEANRHAKKLKGYDLMRFLELQISDIQYAIDLWYDRNSPDDYASGPEATRDEVGFSRSPQRDCCTERVAPAHV